MVTAPPALSFSERGTSTIAGSGSMSVCLERESGCYCQRTKVYFFSIQSILTLARKRMIENNKIEKLSNCDLFIRIFSWEQFFPSFLFHVILPPFFPHGKVVS